MPRRSRAQPPDINGRGSYVIFHRTQRRYGKKSHRPPAVSLKLNPIPFLAVHPGVSNMTPVEEQQMLNSLAAISQDMKALLSLVKDLTAQQEAADQKAYSQLVNIAHKR
jgi:CRISPR/Cas system CMR subunit Cmr6 (Cas7 group RAMP superfamily)